MSIPFLSIGYVIDNILGGKMSILSTDHIKNSEINQIFGVYKIWKFVNVVGFTYFLS